MKNTIFEINKTWLNFKFAVFSKNNWMKKETLHQHRKRGLFSLFQITSVLLF